MHMASVRHAEVTTKSLKNERIGENVDYGSPDVLCEEDNCIGRNVDIREQTNRHGCSTHQVKHSIGAASADTSRSRKEA